MKVANRLFPILAVTAALACGCSGQVVSNPDGGGVDASSRKCGPNIWQCKDGETCVDGYCMPSGSCSKSTDCDGGECKGGRCVFIEPDGEDIDGGTDGGYCETTDNCDKGYRCNESHNCVEAAIISITPPEVLDFGAVSFGYEKVLSLTVTNAGKLPLSLTGFEIQNPVGNVCFRIVSGGTVATLAENEFQVVEIGYKQNGAEAASGKLLIGSTDQKKGIYTILLQSSFKGSPSFTVYDEDGVTLVYPKAGAGYELPLDFGLVPTGTIKHLVWTVTNTNYGNAILALKTLEQISSGTNAVTVKVRKGKAEDSGDLEPPVYIAAADSVYLHAYYDSQKSVEVDRSDFNLTTNDNDINKSGTPGHNSVVMQYSAVSKTSKIDVTPLTINFGEVQKGATLTLPLTISNKGDLDLHIDGTSGLRNSPTWYSIQPGVLARTIRPDDPAFVIQVTFAPTDVKAETNFIDINSDDPAKPHVEVALDAVGVDPVLEVTTDPEAGGTPPTVDLGVVVNGGVLTGKITVKNTGLSGQIYLEDVTIYQGSASVYTITNMKLNGQPGNLPIYLKPDKADVLVFDIEFSSAASGTFPGSLVFKNSDINHKDYTVKMTARSGQANGTACTGDSDCLNLQCADRMGGTGVCCNVACTNPCESCKTGMCTDAGCQTTDKSTCLTDGLCTATKGVCDNWVNGTVCIDAKCSDDGTTSISANLCDGKGLFDSCKYQGTVPCLTYVCDTGNGLCKHSCSGDQDCASNAKCLIPGGQSVGECRLIDGQTCKAGSECFSNSCANGVCCNDPCDGSCESCNQVGHVGACTAVGDGNPDPKGACTAESKLSCGQDGLCGANRKECQKWPSGTECVSATCLNESTVSLQQTCNGTGACSTPLTKDCLPFKCNAGVCKVEPCTSTDDCATGYSCNTISGKCLKNEGQICGTDGDCYSGNCCDNSGTKHCRNLTNDQNNCGSCNNVCQQTHSSNVCLGSQCSPTCNSGYANCSGNTNTGCERDIGSYVNTRADAVNAAVSLSGSGNNTCRSKALSDICNPLTGCNQVGEKYDPGTTRSGTQSEWIRGDVTKANNVSNCDMHVGQTFDLTVPAGVSYQLCIYKRDTSSAASGCITVAGGSAGYTGSMYLQDVVAFDSSWEYLAEVKYISGMMCGQWTLKNYGYRCCH